MNSPQGRAVLVTGAAGGIGSALARRLARDGARLGLLDRDAEGVAALARALGPGHLSAACDVGDWEATRAAVEELIRGLGRLDVLVNNAGITHLSALAETDPAVIRRVMDVNFFGAVHCTRAAAEALAAARGHVVVISSIAGFAPLVGRSGYAASKHALHGLFESARPELARLGIDVTLVCPGFTDTRIGEHALGADGRIPTQPRTTLGRAASPESVADAIARALDRRPRELVLTPVGKLSRLLTRVAPRVYARLMERSLATP